MSDCPHIQDPFQTLRVVSKTEYGRDYYSLAESTLASTAGHPVSYAARLFLSDAISVDRDLPVLEQRRVLPGTRIPVFF